MITYWNFLRKHLSKKLFENSLNSLKAVNIIA
jgi:hypothetical protein